MKQSSQKPSQQSLKHLIEEVVAEECRLSARGLFFAVDELDMHGHPPERIRVWATLHFLPLGSPFCCSQPECHLGLFLDRLGRVNEAVRHRLHLRQDVQVEFVAIGSACHDGVEFDDLGTGRAPSMDWRDVDRRDALGRTALMRAAVRGHERLVEDLLEAGADPAVVDREGRSILERIPKGQNWLRAVLETALGKK